MAHLIDKDALTAEINRRIEEITQTISLGNKKIQKSGGNRRAELVKFLSFLDTLEVKKLERELSYDDYVGFFKEHPNFTDDWGFEEAWVFAKYFFELGLKAQKGE